MAPDFSEVLDFRASQPAPAGAPTPQRLAAMLRESQRGAAVLTELLDSPAWNVFRSVMGADLQACEAERGVLRDQIEAGSLVGDERERADRRLQYLRGAIEKLTRALALPKDLIERHKALDTLARGGDGANGSVVGIGGTGHPTAGPAGAAKPRRKRKTS